MATRRPVKDPGPVATAMRSTSVRLACALARMRSIAGNSASPWRRCACHVSSARTARPSKSATEAHAVEVSRAKRVTELLQESLGTRPVRAHEHAPLGIGDVLEVHVETVLGQGRTGAVGPLDDRDAAAVERLFPAGRPEVLALEPVEVQMEERHTATVVLAQDDERRAHDIGGVETETRRDALREHGLPRAELAPEREHITRLRNACEALADAPGVKTGLRHEI